MSEVELYLPSQVLFSLFPPVHILIINPAPVMCVGNVSFHSSSVFNFLCGVFHHKDVLDIEVAKSLSLFFYGFWVLQLVYDSHIKTTKIFSNIFAN